jgi:hypothetical protein
VEVEVEKVIILDSPGIMISRGKKLHLSFCLLEDSEKDTHPE